MLFVGIIVVFIFVILVVLVRTTGLKKKLRFPTLKGKYGEARVARILGGTVKGKQYVVNDLLFKDEAGQSHQIDHVFINRSGIYVIETKNYAGSIYGNEEQRSWTQVLAGGEVKNEFYNPVKQNATHIYCLSKYLNVKNIFVNVVVFLARADISHVVSDHVYPISELRAVKGRATDISLSVEQMEYYYNKLAELKNSSTVSEEEHIEQIHKKQELIDMGICPRCGGKLVLRDGPHGKFYGCSNYPKCKFIKNIK